MSINKLTYRKIQTAKPKNNPYKIFDGRGLYVLIKPNGTKYWRMKYRIKDSLQVISHLILHRVREPPSKIPYSCKLPLLIRKRSLDIYEPSDFR